MNGVISIIAHNNNIILFYSEYLKNINNLVPTWKPHTGKNDVKISDNKFLAWARDETKLWLSPSVKQRQNPCSGPLACVPGFEYAP